MAFAVCVYASRRDYGRDFFLACVSFPRPLAAVPSPSYFETVESTNATFDYFWSVRTQRTEERETGVDSFRGATEFVYASRLITTQSVLANADRYRRVLLRRTLVELPPPFRDSRIVSRPRETSHCRILAIPTATKQRHPRSDAFSKLIADSNFPWLVCSLDRRRDFTGLLGERFARLRSSVDETRCESLDVEASARPRRNEGTQPRTYGVCHGYPLLRFPDETIERYPTARGRTMRSFARVYTDVHGYFAGASINGDGQLLIVDETTNELLGIALEVSKRYDTLFLVR
ncbi:uncharacterized protein LOC143143585 [Ptiloglossa arizonensis]|uniref:uncharacterized protein LOC143143585 n=1 Tax=Ptiloglossa arizonensis TaxID=3350558 RepID=UPI003F9F33ED